MNIFKAILDLVFPPHCIFCDSIIDFRKEYHICDKCKDSMPLPEGNRCRICYRRTWGEYINDTCMMCKAEKSYFSKLTSVYSYEGLVRGCVLRLKFHKRTDLAPTIGKLMADKLDNRTDAEVIVPVPISKQRLRERGYNQSELFSKELSRRLNIPLQNKVLLKIKDTDPQSRMKLSQRCDNIKGAYKVVSDDIKGKRVLLTDDVTTSRSTLNECARMLTKAGAASVECITFAVTEDS